MLKVDITQAFIGASAISYAKLLKLSAILLLRFLQYFLQN